MRTRSERAIESGLSAPGGALLRGMVLGQDEEIDEDVRESFRASGLAHLLAVSGQNVALLCALALPLLASLGAPPSVRIGALLALIALYVPLAGAGPSLQRAGVMGAAGLVAMAASRPASRVYALLLAAAVTLALNPRAWGDPGWQLSFAAVAGIIVLAPPLRARMQRLPRAIAEGVAVTVAATVATAPLMAHHFGSFSAASLPANVLALPAVPLVMWAGMVAAAVGQLGALGPPFAEWADSATAWIGLGTEPVLGYLTTLAERFGEMPGARLPLPLSSRAGVAGAYALLALALVCAGRLERRLGPRPAAAEARWMALPRGTRRAVLGPIGRRRGTAGRGRAGPRPSARCAHGVLPRRRAGRRHADSGPRRLGRPVRRRPPGGRCGAAAAPGRRLAPVAGGGHPRFARSPRRPARGHVRAAGGPPARRW